MGSPTTTPFIERRHAWGFLVGDPSDGMFTREEVTIASGAGIVTAGLVLGKIGVGAAAYAALGTNTGNPTCSAIVVTQPAVAGEYDVVMDDATHYHVLQPPMGGDTPGEEVEHGVLGTAFGSGGLAFTMTAGGTACVAGDSFKITVAVGSLKYVPFDPTGNDGREVACAILGSEYRDATSADKKAGALLNGPAKVNTSELIWGANVTTTPQQTAALASLKALGIKSV